MPSGSVISGFASVLRIRGLTALIDMSWFSGKWTNPI